MCCQCNEQCNHTGTHYFCFRHTPITEEYKTYSKVTYTSMFPTDYKNAGIQRYLQSIQAIEKELE